MNKNNNSRLNDESNNTPIEQQIQDILDRANCLGKKLSLGLFRKNKDKSIQTGLAMAAASMVGYHPDRLLHWLEDVLIRCGVNVEEPPIRNLLSTIRHQLETEAIAGEVEGDLSPDLGAMKATIEQQIQDIMDRANCLGRAVSPESCREDEDHFIRTGLEVATASMVGYQPAPLFHWLGLALIYCGVNMQEHPIGNTIRDGLNLFAAEAITSLQDLVPFFDMKTGKTIQIPRAELSPGAVWIQIKGEPSPVYANAADITPGKKKHHKSLSNEASDAIRQFKRELSDVCPKSFRKWKNGFLKDRNPDREIRGWFHLSKVLRVMTDQYGYDVSHRKECFTILMACFTGERDTVRERSDPSLLPVEQITESIGLFFEYAHTKDSK